jgi:hypothetical protein
VRIVPVGLLIASLAVPAWAEEPTPTPAAPPAPKAEKAEAPGIAPQAVGLPKPATAIARGRADEEVLVATEDGAVLKVLVGKGITWRANTGGEVANLLAAAPTGDFLAAATATEVLVFGAKQDTVLWRAQRPVAFAFDAAGKRFVSVTAQGEVLEQEAATGKEVARRQIAEERKVIKASLHTTAGLAVLGVADG